MTIDIQIDIKNSLEYTYNTSDEYRIYNAYHTALLDFVWVGYTCLFRKNSSDPRQKIMREM